MAEQSTGSDTRNTTVAVSKAHLADVKSLARLAGLHYREILAMCLASGVERTMQQARAWAEGNRLDGEGRE